MALEFAKHFFGGKTSCKHILKYYKCDFVEWNIQQLQPFIQLHFLHIFRIQKTWRFPKTPPIKEIRKISANKYYKQGVLLLIEQAPVCMIRQYELWEIRATRGIV